ncbi:MAG TPA: DUF72 domain-containing protein [Candidatus Acidoferrales bacterium]|nr:DUF72 domain-containing protein [Candidatus Acidoferrales bacterium]
MAELRIGTSAFTAAGWDVSFYPADLKPRDYLTFYAANFNTVEIDSTFYRIPSKATVQGWDGKTPGGFLVAAKVPQTITHERCLVDCEKDFGEFIHIMNLLGEKLGPLLFQFPYFNKRAFKSVDEFLARLKPFLKTLPKGHKFAVEIRNNTWLNAKFADSLREHGVALVLQDQLWMPLPAAMNFDYLTADFTYIRLLGDRKGIEKQTKLWDKVIVNRSKELRSWVEVCTKAVRRGVSVFVYANNHYQGHAPATVAQFLKLWNAAPQSISRGA